MCASVEVELGEAVLITGASGFIGSAVASRLARRGHAVKAASRHPERLSLASCEAVRMPGPDASHDEWRSLLDGVQHVVHCAGIAGVDRHVPDEAVFEANVTLTARLAESAAETIAGTFVHLSSIRVAGIEAEDIVTEATPPAPTDTYGCAKLESERCVRAAFSGTGRFAILRPVPVYGKGARGAFNALARLAALPVPLPLAGVSGKHSMLDLQALVRAVERVLSMPPQGATYVVCDRNPVTVAELVAAVRRGRGRKPGLFRAPDGLMERALRTAGQEAVWQRLSRSLVADCTALAATGWKPVDDTVTRIETIAGDLF